MYIYVGLWEKTFTKEEILSKLSAIEAALLCCDNFVMNDNPKAEPEEGDIWRTDYRSDVKMVQEVKEW